MSGIGDGLKGDKYGGSYDKVRDDLRARTTDQTKIIRGDMEGNVGLHEGFSNPLRKTERTEERERGSQILFQKLATKLNDPVLAERIFSDIGLQIGGEFRMRDFARIDNRIVEINNEHLALQEQGFREERGRLRDFSDNWQAHSRNSVPESVKELKTFYGPDKTVLNYSRSGYNDYDTPPTQDVMRGDPYQKMVVLDDVDREMKSQVWDRLSQESQSGHIVLGQDRIRQIIDEELQKTVDKYKDRNTNI